MRRLILTGLLLATLLATQFVAAAGAAAADPIQALEFSLSKWQDGQRWEWALQWENVQDGTPEAGAARSWRLWDGNGRKNLGVTQALAPDQWHTLTLTGTVDGRGRVRYGSFVCDGVTTTLGQTFAPTTGDFNAVTVALQLDGDEAMHRQDVYMDKVSVEWR